MSSPSDPRPSSAGVGILLLCLIVLAAAGLWLKESVSSRTPAASDNVPFSVRPITLAPLRSVVQLAPQIYVGRRPVDDSELKALAQLGIRTLVIVEATPPDVEAGLAHGIDSVHLPMTFRAIPRETLHQLARVATEKPASYFIACQDGVQRGPAAAVVIWRCLNPRISAEQSVATVRKLGCTGHPELVATLRAFQVPAPDQLKSSQELPRTTHVPPLANAMAELGRGWDEVASAPSDGNTATAALQLTRIDDLAERLLEASQLPDVEPEMQAEFLEVTTRLGQLADEVKENLRDPRRLATNEGLSQVQDRCDRCHARYRD